MADEGFHEIQLNGKQLIFLFMATTVVAVVIFLAGVMVGRGVRAEKAMLAAELDAAGVAPEPAPATSDTPAQAQAAATEPPASAVPTPPAELSYYDRLAQKDAPEEEKVGGESRPPAAPAEPAARTPAAPPRTPAPQAPAATAGGGYVVQVGAFPERAKAEAIRKQLGAKGYAVFVSDPAPGAPALYRVQVGPVKTRPEADAIRRRLQKEEQYQPFVRAIEAGSRDR